jgi:hypothetical protein
MPPLPGSTYANAGVAPANSTIQIVPIAIANDVFDKRPSVGVILIIRIGWRSLVIMTTAPFWVW